MYLSAEFYNISSAESPVLVSKENRVDIFVSEAGSGLTRKTGSDFCEHTIIYCCIVTI